MRGNIRRTLALMGLFVALVFNGTGPSQATSTAAVAEIQKLYAEFLTFKNDPLFHVVGYGRCCEYYQWMKRVKSLRVNGVNEMHDFLDQFGILPGELITLGMEYYQGRRNSKTALYFESLIASVARPIQSEPALNTTASGTDRTIGTWVYTLYGTLNETVTTKRGGGGTRLFWSIQRRGNPPVWTRRNRPEIRTKETIPARVWLGTGGAWRILCDPDRWTTRVL